MLPDRSETGFDVVAMAPGFENPYHHWVSKNGSKEHGYEEGYLSGQNGNDTLNGGYDVSKYDWLYGGSGSDSFVQNLKRINPNIYYYVSTSYLMDYASGDDTVSYQYFG